VCGGVGGHARRKSSKTVNKKTVYPADTAIIAACRVALSLRGRLNNIHFAEKAERVL
jgi:hypothetical protein